MREPVSNSLSLEWIEALSLSRRRAPEFYQAGDQVDHGSHADAIRFALDDLGLSAVFCIEGVPTIGFLSDADLNQERLNWIHRTLWNQGLLSLLLVIKQDALVAYSLVERPFIASQLDGTDPRLIATLSLVHDSLRLRELIGSTESGRFWFEHDERFDPSKRVDSVLLTNLLQAFRELEPELGTDAAQALLMQTMFIAYLEDRKIIKSEAFERASRNQFSTFEQILSAKSTAAFEQLFAWLRGAFNGNVFNAPCAFDVDEVKPPKLKPSHLPVLYSFRHGREEMGTGQRRLWGYDFRYMPIALISAVYDRFLKEEASRQNADGAFYTPMFLADMAVNQIWDETTNEQKTNGVFFDPACGSGIFLVRLFQRLVAHHCSLTNKPRATWPELTTIAQHLHGGDINGAAVRVAAFSIYIALLELADPPDLDALIEKGKLLPPLYGRTLRQEDFITTPDAPQYDAIIGNPPWKGRAGQMTSAQKWASEHNRPDPAKDIAWGFVWKSLEVIKPGGLIGLLLPAMGTLHNTHRESQDARRLLLSSARVKRIINLSDLCFQLFDGAVRPTAFLLFQHSKGDTQPYRFEYWTPKAGLNLRLKRMMSLTRVDRARLRSDEVNSDPSIFKRRLWTRSPDERLLQYLQSIPTLAGFIRQFKDIKSGKFDRKKDWVIGQGFQPAQMHRVSDDDYPSTSAPNVVKYPYLDASAFRSLALPRVKSKPWRHQTVRRAGFTEGFRGPHIIIPQGVERAIGRVRAAYTEQSLTFEHSLQAIVFPRKQSGLAKLLTATLNSQVAAWFYFHETANLGADRAKVIQADLLKLPFASPKYMPDPKRAASAARKIIQLMDREIATANNLLQSEDTPWKRIDELVCEYYGLDAQDIALIDDSIRYIIPAMQPRRSAGRQEIWRNARIQERHDYALMLCTALEPWFKHPVSASLAGKSADVAILKLQITPPSGPEYFENGAGDIARLLDSVFSKLPTTLPGNVQLVPDLRLIIGDQMYLVKPLQLRHWLRSTALADAEQIAAEFSSVITNGRNGDAAR